jgi:hypothetical protein
MMPMHAATVSPCVKMAPSVVQEHVPTSLKIHRIVAVVHLNVRGMIRVVMDHVPTYKRVMLIVARAMQSVVVEPHVAVDHVRISTTIPTTVVPVVWSAISVVPVDYVHASRLATVRWEKSAVVAVVWAHKNSHSCKRTNFFCVSLHPCPAVLLFCIPFIHALCYALREKCRHQKIHLTKKRTGKQRSKIYLMCLNLEPKNADK